MMNDTIKTIINDLLENTVKAYGDISEFTYSQKHNKFILYVSNNKIKFELKLKNLNKDEFQKIILDYHIKNKQLINKNKTDKNINIYSNIIIFKTEDLYLNFFNHVKSTNNKNIHIKTGLNHISFNEIKINGLSRSFENQSEFIINFIDLLKLFSLFSTGITKIYINQGMQDNFKIKHYFNENIVFKCEYLI